MPTDNEGNDDLSIVKCDDPEKVEILLEDLPSDKREVLLEVLHQETRESGWLPQPSRLKEYNDILPGLAERIVAMPEREQAHRHRVVETAVIGDVSIKKRGQNFALISLCLLLLFGAAMIYFGQYEWAGKIAIYGILGVVGIFVTGKFADIKLAQGQHEEE